MEGRLAGPGPLHEEASVGPELTCFGPKPGADSPGPGADLLAPEAAGTGFGTDRPRFGTDRPRLNEAATRRGWPTGAPAIGERSFHAVTQAEPAGPLSP